MSRQKINAICLVMWENHLVLQEQLPSSQIKCNYELMLIRMFDLLDVTDEYREPIRAAFTAHEHLLIIQPNPVSKAYHPVFLKLIDDLHTFEMRTDGDSYWEDFFK